METHKNFTAADTVTSIDTDLYVGTSTAGDSLCPKATHKLHNTICTQSHTLTPTEGLLDNDVGINLMNANIVHKTCTSRVESKSVLRLHTPKSRYIIQQKNILFYLQIGDVVTWAWFEIVPNLAVGLLLRTFFIDRFTCSVFPSRVIVRPWY